jgi:hypothetical protein
MKKIFLVLWLGLGLTNFAAADPIGFGVKAGAGMANLVPSDFPGINSNVLFGLTGGVFADLGLNDFLSFQPEANFTMKGNQLNVPPIPEVNQYGQVVGEVGGSYSFNLNYFEIPLLLKAHAPLGPQVIGSLSVGPSLGILLNASEHFTVGGLPGSAELNGAGLEGGVVFGAGVEFDRFLLDLRYGLGLTSVYQNDPKGPTNSVLSLTVGYRIL